MKKTISILVVFILMLTSCTSFKKSQSPRSSFEFQSTAPHFPSQPLRAASRTLASTQATADSENAKYNLEFFKNKVNLELLKERPNFELLDPSKVSFKPINGQFLPVVAIYVIGDDKYLENCTGSLIAKNYIITAKHCLGNAEIKNILVGPDHYIAGESKFYSYVTDIIEECPASGWCKDSSNPFYVPPKYKSYSDDFAQDDIVILRIAHDLGSRLGYFNLPKKTDPAPRYLAVAGYPSYAQAVSGKTLKYASEEVCSLAGKNNRALYTNCIPASGISGGPLFVKEGQRLVLWGVLSAAIGEFDFKGNKISGSRFSSIQDRPLMSVWNESRAKDSRPLLQFFHDLIVRDRNDFSENMEIQFMSLNRAYLTRLARTLIGQKYELTSNSKMDEVLFRFVNSQPLDEKASSWTTTKGGQILLSYEIHFQEKYMKEWGSFEPKNYFVIPIDLIAIEQESADGYKTLQVIDQNLGEPKLGDYKKENEIFVNRKPTFGWFF